MEFALVLRELTRRRLLLAVGVALAAAAAILSVYRLDGLALKPRALQYSSARTQVLIDAHSSVLGNLAQSFDPLTSRAVVYANFMTSPGVLEMIGANAGIPGDQIYAAGPIDPLRPRTVQEPTALKRNVQISGETTPYRLNFNSDPNLPTIDIYAQAPSTKQAIALANSSVVGLQQYVAGLENADQVAASARVTIRQLGQASGDVVNGGISKTLAGFVFFAVFVLWCVGVLVGLRFREQWRASAALARVDGGWEPRSATPDPTATEAPSVSNGHSAAAPTATEAATVANGRSAAAPAATEAATIANGRSARSPESFGWRETESSVPQEFAAALQERRKVSRISHSGG